MFFLYAFLPRGFHEGYFFSYVCCCSVTLVGIKGCKIHGGTHKLWDAPGRYAVSVTIHVASFSSATLLLRNVLGA